MNSYVQKEETVKREQRVLILDVFFYGSLPPADEGGLRDTGEEKRPRPSLVRLYFEEVSPERVEWPLYVYQWPKIIFLADSIVARE